MGDGVLCLLLSFVGVLLGWVGWAVFCWIRSFELEKTEGNPQWFVVLFLVLTRGWVLCSVPDTLLEYFKLKRGVLFSVSGWDCYLSICRK